MKKTLRAALSLSRSGLLLGISQQVKADTVDSNTEKTPASENSNNQHTSQEQDPKILATQQDSQVSYQNQTQQLTETIYFQDTSGKEIAPAKKQIVTVSRINTLKDGQVIKYGTWSKTDFPQMKAPKIDGYIPTQPYLDALPANQSFYFVWQYRKAINNTQPNEFKPAPVHPNIVDTKTVSANIDQSDNNIKHPALNLKIDAELKNSNQYNVDELAKNSIKLSAFQDDKTLNQASSDADKDSSDIQHKDATLPQTSSSNCDELKISGLLGVISLMGFMGVRKKHKF